MHGKTKKREKAFRHPGRGLKGKKKARRRNAIRLDSMEEAGEGRARSCREGYRLCEANADDLSSAEIGQAGKSTGRMPRH